MKANIERTDKKRVVIVGGGLGGLELAMKLTDADFQVVLVDKNNYHQFPPLIYQVHQRVLNQVVYLFLSDVCSKEIRTSSSAWQLLKVLILMRRRS